MARRYYRPGRHGADAADETLAGVSLDGKTLCGTLRAFQSAVHLLAAVDHQTGRVLSQSRVVDETNEHKSALVLLKELVLKNRAIVGDALFCQREVCEQILDSGRLLELIRGHWAAIENRTHWGRDVTLDEDRCLIFRGHAPQNLAAFRNAALNGLRQTGTSNLAAKLRSFTRNSQRLFALFGQVN